MALFPVSAMYKLSFSSKKIPEGEDKPVSNIVIKFVPSNFLIALFPVSAIYKLLLRSIAKSKGEFKPSFTTVVSI